MITLVVANNKHKLTLDKGFIFVGPHKDRTSLLLSVAEEVNDDPRYIRICRRFWWFDYQCQIRLINDGAVSFDASKFPEGSYKVSLLKEAKAKPMAFSKTVKLMHGI